MRVTISDELYERFQQRARKEHMSVDSWVASQLARVQDYPVRDRVVIIGSEARDQLEQLFGGGGLVNAEDLVDKVERLAALGIGELRTNFSPGQWEELKRRCERLGVPVEEEAQRIVTKVSELFFDHVGAT